MKSRYRLIKKIGDGLSLFLEADDFTHVLVRASLDEPFDAPGAAMVPAILFGWRAKPLRDCARILTTYTPGGCEGEDIVDFDAVRH